MCRKIGLTLMFWFSFCGLAWAQGMEVELPDGRTVLLYDDHTWEFKRPAPAPAGDTVEVDEPGEYRVVFQASPSSGPDLLELGATVVVDAPTASTAGAPANIADDDIWTDGSLTIERQGLDFVLSEEWDGESYHAGPAFITLVHEDTLAFVHGHAETVDDDRFRFGLDLPARGEYLAALEFIQDGELVTALFRFTL